MLRTSSASPTLSLASRMGSHLRRTAGFTMIEAMISLLGMTVVFVVLAYISFAYATSTNMSSIGVVTPSDGSLAATGDPSTAHEEAVAFMDAVDRDFASATFAKVYDNTAWSSTGGSWVNPWASNPAFYKLSLATLTANVPDITDQYDAALTGNGLTPINTSNWWELHILGAGGQLVSVVTVQVNPGTSGGETMTYNRYTANGGLSNTFSYTTASTLILTPIAQYNAGSTVAGSLISDPLYILRMPNPKLEQNTEPTGTGYNETLVLARVVR